MTAPGPAPCPHGDHCPDAEACERTRRFRADLAALAVRMAPVKRALADERRARRDRKLRRGLAYPRTLAEVEIFGADRRGGRPLGEPERPADGSCPRDDT
ncbi:MAG TPA: hypothetical protein VFV41_10570 [Streptosporangiaceae bacterium]|nr:hypothetical protein [Streptosporangiaceae bacterium]